MKTKEIRDLIDFISNSGLNEVQIETEELKLLVKRNADITTQTVLALPQVQSVPSAAALQGPPPQQVPTQDKSASSDTPASEGGSVAIKSPMIGTFYRAANPESEPFISVGDKIEKGQTVCIIEAMKLFNEIEADVSGTVVKILIEDSSPVEYDQPLILVDPS